MLHTNLLIQVIFGTHWGMQHMAVVISLMLGRWCRPKVWSSWTFLWWVSGDGLHGDGRRIRHRTISTLLPRFPGSGLLDTVVIVCLDPSNAVTLYFQTELTLSSDL